MDVSPLWAKAEFPIDVTLLGIVMDVKALHPLNAASPIVVRLSGRVMDVRPLPAKAITPIEVTLLGIVIDVKASHPETFHS